jgi:hypothetical protein
VSDTRAKFEAFMLTRELPDDLRRSEAYPDQYRRPSIHTAWEVWQAAHANGISEANAAKAQVAPTPLQFPVEVSDALNRLDRTDARRWGKSAGYVAGNVFCGDVAIVLEYARQQRERHPIWQSELAARQAWAPAITAVLDEFGAPHDTGDISECVRGIRWLGERQKSPGGGERA